MPPAYALARQERSASSTVGSRAPGLVPAGSHTSTARRTPSGIGTYSDCRRGNSEAALRPARAGTLAAATIAIAARIATMLASKVLTERDIDGLQVAGLTDRRAPQQDQRDWDQQRG